MELNLREIEGATKKMWSESHIFDVDLKSGKREDFFLIDTPPPTISGKMHIGHAFSYPHQDFIARYKRMNGFKVFYPWGFDDNGLPTERYTEKILGIKGEKTPLAEFIRLCKQESEKAAAELMDGWRDLGLSADFDHSYRTFSTRSTRISQKMFLRMLKNGDVYRIEAPAIRCPTCNTAISQIELKDQTVSTDFVHIEFDLQNGRIPIATTRPEMLAACVALIVNPNDSRYSALIGEYAIVPVYGTKIMILADEYVDMNKGTGAEMLCTFGDQNDLALWRKHNPGTRIVMDSHGVMNETAGPLEGMRINDARKKIVEILGNEGRIRKIERIKHTVNTHERCGTPIEIGISKQWFVRYLHLKKELTDFAGSINWVPDYMKTRLDNWITGLRWDWCISRQRFIGVPFPVWHCSKCQNMVTPEEKDLPVDPRTDSPPDRCNKCGSVDIYPDTDVMDTWATSSLSTRLALPEGLNEETFLEYDSRFQGHDIINAWAFSTIVRSYLHDRKIPWKDIIVSGNVYDPLGQKMSKSKGNVISSGSLIDQYGADSVRYWAATTLPGEDIKAREQDFVRGRRTVVKIYNASKLVAMLSENHDVDVVGFSPELPVNRWMASKFDSTIIRSTEFFENYQVSRARQDIDNLFWNDFCDNYLEICKGLIGSDGVNASTKRELVSGLNYFMLEILKLYAPILPFITEHVYQQLAVQKKKSIHLESWPKPLGIIDDQDFLSAISAIASVRNQKTASHLSMGSELETCKIKGNPEKIVKHLDLIKIVMKVRNLEIIADEEDKP